MRVFERRANDERSWFYLPAEAVTWAGLIYVAFLCWYLPLTPAERKQTAVLLVAFAGFALVLFRWLLPRHGSATWVHRIGIMGAILLLGLLSYILAPYGMRVDAFFVVIIAVAGMTSDQSTTIAAALFCVVMEVLSLGRQIDAVSTSAAFFPFKLILYLATALVSSGKTRVARRQAEHITRRNAELAFLLDGASIATSSLDLDSVFPRLAEKITQTLPASYCRVCLFDEHQETVHTRGARVAASLSAVDWRPQAGEYWPLADMPRLHAAVANARAVCLRASQLAAEGNRKEGQIFFPGTINSVCIVPIVAQGKTLGVIIVGDEAGSPRRPYDQARVDLLQGLAAQLGVVVQNARLHQDTERQGQRFAVLVEIGRAVGSTLDMNDLLELVHKKISQTLPTDTYFVALYDEKEGMFDLHILIDGGQRYPSQRIPLGEGLATWVILRRKPLLIRNMSEELDSLPVKPLTLGQDARSESWLGVPIMTQDSILGLLAVASYQTYAFDEDDMALLSTVAQQAALALDNARHHAQVQDQARRDSLTGVYNHGHLLTLLSEQATACAAAQKPISMIMLDIDHFKLYNDRFGHVVGDAVLRLTAQAIRMHVKRTDIVGRWGGEEFAVVLPQATTVAAQAVAERIRSTLTGLPLVGADGQPVPKPTVSQGIATLPDHVDTAEQLVVAADRALYQAKRSGRDKIRIARVSPSEVAQPQA